jgi:hypothetical protein
LEKGLTVELLDFLLGRKNRRDGITETIGTVSRWILGCGCMLVLLTVGGIVAVLGGIISFGQDPMTVLIVFVTIIVAVISLIRSSLGH